LGGRPSNSSKGEKEWGGEELGLSRLYGKSSYVSVYDSALSTDEEEEEFQPDFSRLYGGRRSRIVEDEEEKEKEEEDAMTYRHVQNGQENGIETSGEAPPAEGEARPEQADSINKIMLDFESTMKKEAFYSVRYESTFKKDKKLHFFSQGMRKQDDKVTFYVTTILQFLKSNQKLKINKENHLMDAL
jgi:hypothetical protein